MSQLRSASESAGIFTPEKNGTADVIFVVSSHDASCKEQMTSMYFTKPFFGLCPQYSCSIHSKRWDSIHSKSITAQWLTTALFYNHTITIFMRAPADGKTISLHPPPPTHTPTHLSLSPLFFCGPHSFLWAYFNEKLDGESRGDLARLVISPTRGCE